MKKWVWQIGLAAAGAFSALLAACSDGTNTAGSSFETENSVAMTVQLADGTPAARTKIMVRPNDFLAGASSRTVKDLVVESDSAAGIFNEVTDGQGRLTLPRMKAGNYVVEARGESKKAFARFTVKDSVCDTLSMELATTGSMKGQVLMPAGVSSVSVGIRGLDYVVRTDSLGNFEFPSLPEGAFNAVGFIYSTYDYVDVNGNIDVFESFQALGVAPVTVSSDKTLEDVVIGSRAQAPVDTVPADTVNKDTVAEDSVEVYPYLLLDDFENGTYGWYTSVSKYASVKLTDVKGGGKFGQVASLDCHKDSLYIWTMMGHNFSKFYDFTGLDSVVLWARGLTENADSMWVSVSFDVHVDNSTADSLLGYELGKAWAHMPLGRDGEWVRVVVTPDDLVPPDSLKIGGNIGWDAVKEHVNSIGIFAGSDADSGDYELQVDDVEIFGVRELAP